MRLLIAFLVVNLTNVLVAQTPGSVSDAKKPAEAQAGIHAPLPRRGLLGAQPAAVTADIREREGLKANTGVVLIRVIQDTAAAKAGFKVGDVVLSVDGVPVNDVATFMKSLTKRRAGDNVKLKIVRNGATLEKQATLGEFPREKDAAFNVTYKHVTSHESRLRTILTRPKNGDEVPAVLLLQGFGNHSIDNAVAPSGFTRLAHHLARKGYVTMRVDRRGCGDSEGGPCHDMDFETELDGYRQSLKAMKSLDFVDQQNIFIFGQSLGGSTGPIIAAETPVRGIITHGTGGGNWFHGLLGQRRRWAELDGSSPADVTERIRREARYWYTAHRKEDTC